MISIIIPTYNGENTLGILLKQIINLEDNIKKEIIIIDSSSSDNTVKIAKKYTNKVYVIPKKSFNHGSTRNYAVSLSSKKSKHIFFTTQDTKLKSKHIFSHYLKVFNNHPKVIAAFGPHMPHPNTSLFESSEVICLFNRIYKYYKNPNNKDCWEKFFISHNNAMYKKKFLIKHPFKKTSFAEDLEMGIYLEKHGFKKTFIEKATIFHSHSYSLKKYYQREKQDLQHRSKLNISTNTNFLCKFKAIINSNASFKEKLTQTIRGLLRYAIKLYIKIL